MEWTHVGIHFILLTQTQQIKGQSGPPEERLKDRCDEGPDYITLGFVNSSPENNPTGFPSINFASHCWATGFPNSNGDETKLLNHCGTIQQDLQYCRDKGIKMLLSIGGVFNTGANNYRVTTPQKGRDFADFLWKAFGPYDPTSNVPRPFDDQLGGHSQVDGFDFDLEMDSFGETLSFSPVWKM